MKYLVAMLALALAGCATTFDRQDVDRKLAQLQSQGASGYYQVGFEEGCISGKAAGGSWGSQMTRSIGMYKAEPDYREGWHYGFDQCKGEEDASSRNYSASSYYGRYRRR